MESRLNMINLNLEILDIIFSKLKLEDQINLAFAHPSLREVFLFHNRGKLCQILMIDDSRPHKGCQLNAIRLDKFPVTMWDLLFSLCGPMVESFLFDCYCAELSLLMNCVVKHCKSLQKLVLEFNYHHGKDDVFVRIIKSIQELPKLRKLRLKYYPWHALIHIRELTQLEECDLQAVDDVVDIGHICATLKNLRALIYRGYIEHEYSFQDLPQFCPLLEKLTLLMGTNVEEIPHFPKLKQLTVVIYEYNRPLAESFQDLPQFCPLLEKLWLDMDNPIQIPYFPKLKELEIGFYGSSIDQILGTCGNRYAKQLDKLIIFTHKPIANCALLAQLCGIKHFEIITRYCNMRDLLL